MLHVLANMPVNKMWAGFVQYFLLHLLSFVLYGFLLEMDLRKREYYSFEKK